MSVSGVWFAVDQDGLVARFDVDRVTEDAVPLLDRVLFVYEDEDEPPEPAGGWTNFEFNGGVYDFVSLGSARISDVPAAVRSKISKVVLPVSFASKENLTPMGTRAESGVQRRNRAEGTVDERLQALVSRAHAGDAAAVRGMLDVLASGEGSVRTRVALGEALGRLGDPRLRRPSDADYWVRVASEEDGDVVIARYPVTNDEYRAWVERGGYQDRAAWSDEGWAWLQATTDPWPVHAKSEGSEQFVVANQPVVVVTFFEAQAYAAAHGARLVRTDERVFVVRGEEKRPYPWGSPFGEGNANTREEVVNRPCAVGLFIGDRTPEGVCDLAGNVAEWTDDDEVDSVDYDGVEEGTEPPVRLFRVVHPGAWDQPSMASWAKAKALHAPESRWPGLGFRLAKDA
jgi:hypothetical protein